MDRQLDLLARRGLQRGGPVGLRDVVQERDVQLLGVVGAVTERVQRHHRGELLVGAHHHVDAQPELVLDRLLQLLPDGRLLGLRVRRGERDVAALQVGVDVAVPELLEQGPQVGHLDPVGAAQVDRPQQGRGARPDLPIGNLLRLRHRDNPARAGAGAPLVRPSRPDRQDMRVEAGQQRAGQGGVAEQLRPRTAPWHRRPAPSSIHRCRNGGTAPVVPTSATVLPRNTAPSPILRPGTVDRLPGRRPSGRAASSSSRSDALDGPVMSRSELPSVPPQAAISSRCPQSGREPVQAVRRRDSVARRSDT